MSTFDARMRELAESVGNGHLVSKVEFDQPYSAAIHEGGWISGPLAGVRIRHHTDGQAPPSKFLEKTLMQDHPRYMQRLADNALEPGGLERAAIENAEAMAQDSASRAPVETGSLSHSDHASVTSDGQEVYDRPAGVPRLR